MLFRFLRQTYIGAGIIAICLIGSISCVVQTLEQPISVVMVRAINFIVRTGFRDTGSLRELNYFWQASVGTGLSGVLALLLGFGIGCKLYPKKTHAQ